MAILLLLGLAPVVWSGEPSDSADSFLTALCAEDEVEIRRIANDPTIDPWLVVAELLDRSEAEAVREFLSRCALPDAEGLAGYVDSRENPGRPEARGAFKSARAALAEDDAAQALAVVDAAPAPKDELLRARLDLLRAECLLRLERWEELATAVDRGLSGATALGWRRGQAIAHQTGAHSLLMQGDPRRAIPHLLAAHELLAELGDTGAASKALLNAGIANADCGESAEALAVLDRAEEAFAAVGDGPIPDSVLGQIRETQGYALMQLGRFRLALERLEEALGLHVGEDPQAVVARIYTLSHLGSVYLRIGDLDASVHANRQVADLCAQLGAAEEAANVRGNLAHVLLIRGDARAALAEYEAVLTIMESLGNAEGAATARVGIAHALLTLDRPAEGEDLCRTVLDHYRATEDRPAQARTLGLIAMCLKEQGRTGEALATFDQADLLVSRLAQPTLSWELTVDRAETELAANRPARAAALAESAIRRIPLLVGDLSDVGGLHGLARRSRVFTIGVRAALALSDDDLLFRFLESGRAGALLLALENREEIRAANIPALLLEQERGLRGAEASARLKLREAFESGVLKEIRDRRKDYDDCRQALESHLIRIQREAKAGVELLYPTPATVEAVTARLATGSALVLYGTTGDAVLAMVLEKDQAPRVVHLGAEAPLRSACADLAFEQADGEFESSLAHARTLLIEPLDLGADTHRLLVSPDAYLSYVPFGALAPDRDVALVPSATTWQRLLADGGAPREKVLALGDPDYSESPGRGEPMAALPESRVEAKAVGDEGLVLLGKLATEAELRRLLASDEGFKAVHLACHAVVDPVHPTLSSLALTPTREDDGRLTALEVFQMRIPADLVVLSACRTGRGRILGGEGIVGLTRAFMLAGAPRVIVSLWDVDDAATRALMIRFYELWQPGEVGTAEALAGAQEHIRNQPKWRHPHFWAAWSLWGLPD